MNINLSISAAPSITDKLAVVIFLASSPSVIFDSQEFDPPHVSPRNITFADVNPETYIVNTYETTGLPALGTLRHSFIYDPTLIGAEIRLTEFLFMVGGSDAYTNTDWIGWTIESIERVGLGTQFEEDSPDTTVPGSISIREDGFDLTQSGDTFGDNEKWVVRFYPKITTINPIFRSAKIIRSYRIIDSDTTLTDEDAGVGIRLKGASSHFIVTVPEITTLENALMYMFISDGGVHIGVTIQRTGTTDIFDLQGSKTYIELVQGDRLWVGNDNENSAWIVSKEPASQYRRGQIIDMYNKPVNAYDAPWIFADGVELDRTIYKGLFDYYSALPASAKVSKATWDLGETSKGKWHSGDGATTFGTPRLYSAGFLRSVDGTIRLPGDMQDSAMPAHRHHTVKIGDSEGSVTVTNAINSSKNNGQSNGYILSGIADDADGGLSSDMVDDTGNAMITSDDLRPTNTGIYKLIFI